MGGIRIRPPGARQRAGTARIWPHIQFQRMNYPTWPPPNASPLHPLEPWGRQLFVFRPYAGDLSAAIKGPYPRIPPLRGPVPPFDQLSPHLERLATAAAEAVDAAEDAEHMQQFKQLIEDFRQEATASNIEGIYAFRRRLLPYKTVGMQRMKKGEHQSYGMKKGVPREKKT
ncbi:hypothetical protein cyc_04597 [Cyclospora cayetanensis]|uniref:Uncharacterized protein n=1 Tax=Cyclospora cayetanensis TaxID=88456 RepID=A0A1D3D492_9EIME|nr:hypothetical protein cyc_04597 [Cyclospora cayetanensis]